MDWQDFYELKKWNGMDMYQCKVCSHSTVDGVKDILAHVGSHFPAQMRRELADTEKGADVLDAADELFAADISENSPRFSDEEE